MTKCMAAFTSWFARKGDSTAADEANTSLKLGKHKSDPEHFWTDYLTPSAGDSTKNQISNTSPAILSYRERCEWRSTCRRANLMAQCGHAPTSRVIT